VANKLSLSLMFYSTAVQPVATRRQSPHLHKPAIVVVTSFSLWRHSLLSWPRPPLRTYVRTLRTDTLPRLIYRPRDANSQWAWWMTPHGKCGAEACDGRANVDGRPTVSTDTLSGRQCWPVRRGLSILQPDIRWTRCTIQLNNGNTDREPNIISNQWVVTVI